MLVRYLSLLNLNCNIVERGRQSLKKIHKKVKVLIPNLSVQTQVHVFVTGTREGASFAGNSTIKYLNHRPVRMAVFTWEILPRIKTIMELRGKKVASSSQQFHNPVISAQLL